MLTLSAVTGAREKKVLQISDDNRVRTITLDRPEVLNAFDEALYQATAAAIRAAAADPDVAVVLLTGNGRAFSAGNDLNEMQTRSAIRNSPTKAVTSPP